MESLASMLLEKERQGNSKAITELSEVMAVFEKIKGLNIDGFKEAINAFSDLQAVASDMAHAEKMLSSLLTGQNLEDMKENLKSGGGRKLLETNNMTAAEIVDLQQNQAQFMANAIKTEIMKDNDTFVESIKNQLGDVGTQIVQAFSTGMNEKGIEQLDILKSRELATALIQAWSDAARNAEQGSESAQNKVNETVDKFVETFGKYDEALGSAIETMEARINKIDKKGAIAEQIEDVTDYVMHTVTQDLPQWVNYFRKR